MIEFQDLSVNFGATRVLNKISSTIHLGEAVAILGLSGSGKSTLLKCLVGLIPRSEGQILWDNVALTSQNLKDFRNTIGYMPQDGGLFPNLSNFENVILSAVDLDMSVSQKKARVEKLAELCQLPQSVLSKKPKELSGGQRQRVSLMRALFNDPQVLLLDEPFGALDPIIRNELQEYMKELLSRIKKTLILVTHDIFEAHFLSDRILLLKSGQIVQSGTLKEFIENPSNTFVSDFVGVYQRQIKKGIL